MGKGWAFSSGGMRSCVGLPEQRNSTPQQQLVGASPTRQQQQQTAAARRAQQLTMPTLGPGWNSVPRCRTMMLPGLHRCPPNSLTPRYLGSESLVFCVEPPCFLEAQRSCCHCTPAAAPPLPPPHELLQASAAAALRVAAAAKDR